MFGLGFSELILIGLVAVVVIGPKQLPTMLRSLGQTFARLRRMSQELREQSGLDDLMREAGIDGDLRQLRSVSKSDVIGALVGQAAARAQIDVGQITADMKTEMASLKADVEASAVRSEDTAPTPAATTTPGPAGTLARGATASASEAEAATSPDANANSGAAPAPPKVSPS